MTNMLARHQATLDHALHAIKTREFWSPYPEHPKDPRYGDNGTEAGLAAFESRLGKPFDLDQPGVTRHASDERSPYGTALGITYAVSNADALLDAAMTAKRGWAGATPDERAGACLEILDRLNRSSHEMAHAVMHTTGQAYLMAFQAGGPHAQDRGLEALAYAYAEMRKVPASTRWTKPQGKRDPIVLNKQYRIVPRGIGLVIGCSTFPTWNAYPAIFADLVTGNPVIIKPHPQTVLPMAITVEVGRSVLAEAGFDPNVMSLLVDTEDALIAKEVAMDPRIGVIDYTGSTPFGTWLERNVHHAEVFTEKAGVNSVIVDSTDDLQGLLRNLSVSLSMYSGQMCTAPQTVFVPPLVETDDGDKSFDEIVEALSTSIEGLLADDERAAGILGAIKSEATLDRVERAQENGEVALASRSVPAGDAEVRTPAVVVTRDSESYGEECFGPVIFVVPVTSTHAAIVEADRLAREKGAISWLVYSTDDAVVDEVIDAALGAAVSVSFNLTGAAFVNQNAAFSDFHVSGANPAGNASLSDPAFVASRFRVAQVRMPAPG